MDNKELSNGRRQLPSRQADVPSAYQNIINFLQDISNDDRQRSSEAPSMSKGKSVVGTGSATVTARTLSNFTTEGFDPLELKTALNDVYPIFIGLNFVVFFVGLISNSVLIIKVVTTLQTRHSRVLQYLANAALCDIFKLLFVLPITLANLLLHHFVFGPFLCYILPLLQVFPIHASIINYSTLTYDRYRGIRFPDRRRSSVFVHGVASWLLALVSVLPYTGYIVYIDLEPIRGPFYRNVGLCFIDVQNNIEDYFRATFFLLFLIPSIVMMFLLIRTSWELGFQRRTEAVCICDSKCDMHVDGHPSRLQNGSEFLTEPVDAFGVSNDYSENRRDRSTSSTKKRQPSEDVEAVSLMGVECAFCVSELQWREQGRVAMIVGLFVVAWIPVNICILVTHFYPENAENLGLLNNLNLALTLFGFTSTCCNPFIVLPMITRRVRMSESCQASKVEPEPQTDATSKHRYHNSFSERSEHGRPYTPRPHNRRSASALSIGGSHEDSPPLTPRPQSASGRFRRHDNV